jgi:V/A-type H+-transporting ATPase subunit E
MHNKLQELTDKIYNEGIEKANAEAGEILAKARQEAENIVAEAKRQAESINTDAISKAEEVKRNLDAEIKLAVTQAMSALKQQTSESVTLKVIEPPVQKLFADNDFLKALIVNVVKGWVSAGNFDLNLILPEADKQLLEQHLKNSLANELNAGVRIEFSKSLKSGFKIGPAKESYVVNFTDDDFVNYFKTFLKSKTNQLLFGKQ